MKIWLFPYWYSDTNEAWVKISVLLMKYWLRKRTERWPKRRMKTQYYNFKSLHFAFTVLYKSNLHFLQNQLSDTMLKNIFRSTRCKNPLAPTSSNFRATDKKPNNYTIDSSKSRFYANPFLVNAHFFSKDTNRFTNFLLKKLDNHNNRF
jgi:hypothetical protein